MILLKEREINYLIIEASEQLKLVSKIQLFMAVSDTEVISEKDLEVFINQKNHLKFSRNSASALVRRLDKDKDGSATFRDFVDTFGNLEDQN